MVNQRSNPPPDSEVCHQELLMGTEMENGTEELARTLIARTGHGGESILASSKRFSRFPFQTEPTVVGIDWARLISELAILTTTQQPMLCKLVFCFFLFAFEEIDALIVAVLHLPSFSSSSSSFVFFCFLFIYLLFPLLLLLRLLNLPSSSSSSLSSSFVFFFFIFF